MQSACEFCNALLELVAGVLVYVVYQDHKTMLSFLKLQFHDSMDTSVPGIRSEHEIHQQICSVGWGYQIHPG